MKAAVVNDFTRAPQFRDFEEPSPEPEEVVVSVRAAALSQLVRGQASGKHYSSGTRLPLVPGGDGVGRLSDGRRVYFAFPRAPFGSMAECTVVPSANCIGLPDDVDDVTAAAVANPGMSSWAGLTERARFQPGESVLINGATGVSGQMAIRIARHLGARRVIATGRNSTTTALLSSLGSDVVIPLDQPPERLTEAFREQIREHRIGVILDYLWGPSAEILIAALSGHGGAEAEPRVRYVQIGSMAAPTITLSSGALRSSGLELLGSGLGSVSSAGLLRSIDGSMKAVVPAGIEVQTEVVPLKDVEQAWASDGKGRIVFTV